MSEQLVYISLTTQQNIRMVTISVDDGNESPTDRISYPVTYRESCFWGYWATAQKREAGVICALLNDGWIIAVPGRKIAQFHYVPVKFYDCHRRDYADHNHYEEIIDQRGYVSDMH